MFLFWNAILMIISHFFFKMENAVTESNRLSGIDENVCILHDNTQNMFWVFDEKYETLSIYNCCWVHRHYPLANTTLGRWCHSKYMTKFSRILDLHCKCFDHFQVCIIEGSRNAIDRCLEYLRDSFPLEYFPKFTIEQINRPKPATFNNEPGTTFTKILRKFLGFI